MAGKDLIVPERRVPVPGYLSAGAQAALAMPGAPAGGYPALDDHAGWKARVAAMDAFVTERFVGALPSAGYTVSEVRAGEARGFEVVPDGLPAGDRRVYLDIHGGALIMGSGEVCKAMAIGSALRVGARVVSVDYRMPPDHPYPASLDDCLAFYRQLLESHAPSDIVVGGGSAGANLAAATVLRARDEGLPLPAGLVLSSPEADLTESGDSFATNAGLDPMGSLMQVNLLYANGHDLAHPYLSPLFGDFAKGFPPTLLTAGTRDLFLSNAARMHRALRDAGVAAELHIIDAAPHGAFGGRTPEEASISREMRQFCDRCWAG